jgi:hypothetical protein
MSSLSVRKESPMELYDFLKTQFKTLDEAKLFINKWYNDWDQHLDIFGDYTIRAMCAHCSNVLEGKPFNDGFLMTNYITTNYGRELYNSIDC